MVSMPSSRIIALACALAFAIAALLVPMSTLADETCVHMAVLET